MPSVFHLAQTRLADSREADRCSLRSGAHEGFLTEVLIAAQNRPNHARHARLHHSDRGSQYTSEQFQRLMADHGVTCSMSRSGNCWDNAAMEIFFSTLKIERTARKTYRTRDQAKANVFDYIELLQPQPKALDAWLSQPRGVRKADVVSLGYCQPNRQQLTHLFCALHGLQMYDATHGKQEPTMIGKCPKCEATANITVEPLRARDEASQRTLPVLQFLCDQCKTILSIVLDPEWQAQIVAGQLRTIGQPSKTSH